MRKKCFDPSEHRPVEWWCTENCVETPQCEQSLGKIECLGKEALSPTVALELREFYSNHQFVADFPQHLENHVLQIPVSRCRGVVKCYTASTI